MSAYLYRYLPLGRRAGWASSVPRADSRSRDKGPRGGCNTLVDWCLYNRSWEGIMNPHRRQLLHLAASAPGLLPRGITKDLVIFLLK
jgi:hypothetical protein